MRKIISIIVLNTLLTGCVSVTRFDEQKTALEACQDEANKNTQAWQVERSSLEENLNKITGERDSCRNDLSQVETSVQDVEKRANELRHTLQDEILSRNVEIETLKGKLSVHVLDRILFKSGSADILPDGKALLKKLAGSLAATEDYIRVEGHTDSVPIGEQLKAKFFSNWELSAARAASVVRFFEYGHKISPLRLEAVGFSQYRPVTEGKTVEELQRNRRVEIILTQPRSEITK